ncbi:signal recognition particle-docking protein FtsY [Alkaliphilus transvaalensis]|uniref:signal recognition particle-docking protein FtsY n=1 Tax=Alkaliphilus transvaalensis TaxID=114628 RepID=UPI00047C96CE|nr:signal recognition particle-docking protein FtsY [Alkaliphilus transvaalensis]
MFKKLFEKLKGTDKKNQEIIESEEIKDLTEDLENLNNEEELVEIVEEEFPMEETEENLSLEEAIEEMEEALEEEADHAEELEKIEILEKVVEAEIKEEIKEEEVKKEAEEAEVVVDEIINEEPQEKVSEEVQEEAPSKFNLFKRLKEGLAKTKQGITGKIEDLVKSYQKIDEELFEELEEILITADLGVETTMEVIDDIRDRVKKEKITDPNMIKELLKDKLASILDEFAEDETLKIEPSPAIILVVGVNGVGKTTSIGKIANRLKQEGKKVVLAAGDTFRAAAADQLKIWGDRVGVEVVQHQEGSDPAAVIFDGIQAAKSRNADVLICDTAGRLHNKKNLMNELGKIFKIVEREYPNATREVLLVLDATTGQNAIQQAKIFKEVADITGLVLTKLDGTAKGGVVIAISRELQIPVKLIGVGEKMEDLQEFNSRSFVSALFGEE